MKAAVRLSLFTLACLPANPTPVPAADPGYEDRGYPDHGKYPDKMKQHVLPLQWPLIQAPRSARGKSCLDPPF